MKPGCWLTLFGLLLIAQGCAALPTKEIPSTLDIASQVESTLTAIAVEIPPSPTPATSQWQTQKIDLFGFTLDLPQNWTITETNRRPESTDDPMFPIMGHDCADYEIANPDGSERLYINPICGYADGSGDACPLDTVLLETRGETGVLVRYVEESSGRYIFSEARFATLLDRSGEIKQMLCFRPPVMVFEIPNFTQFVQVEYQFSGAPENREVALAIVDRIVTSLELR